MFILPGGCFVMGCPDGQVWDQAANTCNTPPEGLRALELILKEIDYIEG